MAVTAGYGIEQPLNIQSLMTGLPANRESGVTIQRILVADRIIAGNLVAKDGCNLEQNADDLAAMRGQAIMNYLEEKYPGVEVCVDIAIQREAGPDRPVEAMAYVSDEEMDPVQSTAIQQQLAQHLATIAAGQS